MKQFQRLFFLLIFSSISVVLFAQGDGPKTHLPSPKSVTGIYPKLLHMNQNLSPNSDIIIPDADLRINAFPTTVFHTFAIDDRFMQVLVMTNPTGIKGEVDNPINGQRVSTEQNALSDGFIGVKVGLINGKALSPQEFAQAEQKFTLYGYGRVWYSGSFDAENIINIGINRTTLQFGTPMAIPINKKGAWLEVFPSAKFFTTNHGESGVSSYDEITQKALLSLESHMTYPINKKLWFSTNVGYQNGGETATDGIENDNKFDYVGGTLGLGYKLKPYLSLDSDYGGRILGDDGARSRLFRVGLLFTYANVK